MFFLKKIKRAFNTVLRKEGRQRFDGMAEYTFSGAGETRKVRDLVLPFIQHLPHGLDIGYGGDTIQTAAITLDTPVRGRSSFGGVGNFPQHLQGNAGSLYWFRDNVLDYIYSSHCLEDFLSPVPVLHEWLRVIKPGGVLVLYLPDEIKFKETCKKKGQPYNNNHNNPEMSLRWMRALFAEKFPGTEIIFERDIIPDKDPYGFLIIVKKK